MINKNNWGTIEVTSVDLETFIEDMVKRSAVSPVVFVDSRVQVTKGWLTLLLAALGEEEISGVFPKIRPGPSIDKRARAAAKTLGSLSVTNSFDPRCFVLEKKNLLKLTSHKDIKGLNIGSREKVKIDDEQTKFLLVSDAVVGWPD